jgi:hypothetical protein
MKYTKENLESAVKKSISIAEVMRILGIKRTGGSHSHISRRIQKLNINTIHFNRYGYEKTDKAVRRKTWKDILVLRTNGKRQPCVQLRRALIQIGRECKCEVCGLSNTWNNRELVLEIDHKNRNWQDDRKENLRFICPNCHSQI